jgi:hypothetical protein
MRKLMLLAAGAVLLALSVAGCTSAQQANLATLATNAQTKVNKACGLVQPVLLDLSASIPADPNLARLAKDNGKLCAAIATLDPTNVKSLVDTAIPEAIALVSLLPIDSVTQGAIRIALGAAQLALSNWLTDAAPVTTASAGAASDAAGASSAVAQ